MLNLIYFQIRHLSNWLYGAITSLLLSAIALNAHAETVVSPTQSVAGLSQAEWSQAWWQWAGSFDFKTSPVADRTGEYCHLKQTGPVWFLAGTYGTKRTIRNCRVPQGKYIFFPLINYVVTPKPGKLISCSATTLEAERLTNDASALILEVDGIRVQNLITHRQATNQCFSMSTIDEPKYQVYPSAANGYYIMLQPLPPGVHTLNFGGALPSILQAVTYTLVVE